MTVLDEQIDRLLAWTARLAPGRTDMPWAEPPPQPTAFDRRDALEAEEFARLVQGRVPSAVRCEACGYRADARGHFRMCA